MRTQGMRRWAVLLMAGAAALGAAGARADGGAATDASDPSVFSGLKLAIGIQQGLDATNADQLYYRLEYRGVLVRDKGSEIADADAITSATKAGLSKADSNMLSLTMEHGQGTGGGQLFDALGLTKPLSIPWLREMRGAFRISGATNGDDITFAMGAETPPLHLLPRGLSTPNWLIVGMAGQAHSGEEESSRNDLAATWRVFIGRSLGRWVRTDQSPVHKAALEAAPTYRKALVWDDAQRVGARPGTMPGFVRDVVESAIRVCTPGGVEAPFFQAAGTKKWHQWVAAKLGGRADEFLKVYPTLSDALEAYWAQAGAAGGPSEDLVRVIEPLNLPSPDDATWLRELDKSFRECTAPPDQPSGALWLEGCGWYQVTGEGVGGRRFNNLFAATATWWIHPEDGDRQWIRLRYEVGRSRSDPGNYRNRLLVSTGLSF